MEIWGAVRAVAERAIEKHAKYLVMGAIGMEKGGRREALVG